MKIQGRTLKFVLLFWGCMAALVFLPAGYGQIRPKCQLEYFSSEQGLTHKSITHRIKDSEGFMWFGTWSGINRFDGRKFAAFKSTDPLKQGPPNERIDQLAEAGPNQLWVLANDRQLYLFNKKDWGYKNLEPLVFRTVNKGVTFNRLLYANAEQAWVRSDADGLFLFTRINEDSLYCIRFSAGKSQPFHIPSNTINFLYRDSPERVWIGTSAGLACLVNVSGKGYQSIKLSGELSTGGDFTAFNADRDNLYFGNKAGKLLITGRKNLGFSLYPISTGPVQALFRSRVSNELFVLTGLGELLGYDVVNQTSRLIYRHSGPLLGLMEDRKGILWIEPDGPGAIRVNPQSRTGKLLLLGDEIWPNAMGNRYRVIEDKEGRVWVNLKGGRFGYFDETYGRIETVVHTPEIPELSLPRHVAYIHYDTSGILWLTTNDKQLIKLTLQVSGFNQVLPVPDGEWNWENEIRGLMADRDGRLWAATKGGQLFVYKNGRHLNGLFVNAPPGGFGVVYTMLEDKKGNIWLGTKGNGLFLAKPASEDKPDRYEITHFRYDTANGLPCNEIYSIIEDSGGGIWIGSFDAGLVKILGVDAELAKIRVHNRFTGYPGEGYQKIRSLACDEKGRIWAGTTQGLLILEPDNRNLATSTVVTFIHQNGHAKSLGRNDVQYVYCDSKKRMWVGTAGGGIGLADWKSPMKTLEFRNFTTNDGLPNDYILSCIEDFRGILWMATENGICQFDPETLQCRNYNSYDGLPGSGFAEASVCRIEQASQIVFGSTRGLIIFDPLAPGSPVEAAHIAFTNLQVNQESLRPGDGSGILSEDINYQQHIKLAYNQNTIAIEFALLEPRMGSHKSLFYRLVGLDTAWHDDRMQRMAVFNKLRPGNYRFEVMTPGATNDVPPTIRTLTFRINPPFWKTNLAYFLYALLAGMVFFFARRTALTMLRLRNKIELEQKLAAMKQSFFTQVSHELRTPLTLIMGPLEQVGVHENLSEEGKGNIAVARRNAVRLLRFVNQLLDFRKVENGGASLKPVPTELISLINRVADHFAQAAKSRQIVLETHFECPELFMLADADKLDVVLYNLMGNALKFSQDGKKIQVGVYREPDANAVKVLVSDQGTGVNPDQLDKIFELFYEGNHSGKKNIKGSGIGLALSKEFIRLHEGSIWAQNNPGGGLTVGFILPVKPVDPAQIAEFSLTEDETTVTVTDNAFSAGQAVSQTVNSIADKELVLLVDDDEELRLFLRSLLARYYRVETAKNGLEGLQKANEMLPDLVVSDIMMPEMDGIEMLEKLKAGQATSHIPVVLLSARQSMESQIEGLKSGADFYITKPFNAEYLFASVQNLLHRRQKAFNEMVQGRVQTEQTDSSAQLTPRDQAFLQDVIRFVENNMNETDFNIEIVARSMAMSRSVFHKKFKSLTGTTTVDFIRDMRLDKSLILLTQGHSIAETAYLTGFTNPKYFSTCFREKFNQTPSEFQRSKLRH